jgi:hypothetical protein
MTSGRGRILSATTMYSFCFCFTFISKVLSACSLLAPFGSLSPETCVWHGWSCEQEPAEWESSLIFWVRSGWHSMKSSFSPSPTMVKMEWCWLWDHRLELEALIFMTVTLYLVFTLCPEMCWALCIYDLIYIIPWTILLLVTRGVVDDAFRPKWAEEREEDEKVVTVSMSLFLRHTVSILWYVSY